MLFLIFSQFIISPDTLADPKDEIVIFFEDIYKDLVVLLDGKEIKGERKEDYFYYQFEEPLKEGKHILTIIINNDTTFYIFKVLSGYEKENINSADLGLGFLYNPPQDATFYSIYKEGSFFIFNLDFDLYIKDLNISGSFYKDPEYYYSFFGLLKIKNKFLSLDAGIISPILDELILYGLTGLGGVMDLKIKNISFSPIFLYSYEEDTLISEYKRIIFGGRFWIDSIFSTTILRGYDDTTDIEGIPLYLPIDGILISSYIGIPFKIKPYLNIAYSKGSFNSFEGLDSKGVSFEFGIKNTTFTSFYRFVDSSYLSIGNPFIEKGDLISLDAEFEIKRFKNVFNIDLYPNFHYLNTFRINGIFSVSRDFAPFNTSLSISHSEDLNSGSSITSLSNGINFRKSFLFLSENLSYTISDTLSYFSISTNNSFSFEYFNINMSLQYSNSRYSYLMSIIFNLMKTGINIDIGGVYEDGKHTESYKCIFSVYF